jgi:hypothetical protein
MIDVAAQTKFVVCKTNDVFLELDFPNNFSINIDLFISFP